MRREQPVWDSGQSFLHKDDKGRFRMENAYGKLQYIKGEKNGFILEAKEAPGTPVHTEKELHLQLDKVKKVKMKGERFLYAEERPFLEQAFFYDISEKEKSREFMKCMKRMLKERGHRTIKNTLGFMEQSPERLQEKMLKQERMKKLSLEEFAKINHELDTLNDRLRKKESRERQLYAELQLMIDRGREEKAEKGRKGEERRRAVLGKTKLQEADHSKNGMAEDITEEIKETEEDEKK